MHVSRKACMVHACDTVSSSKIYHIYHNSPGDTALPAMHAPDSWQNDRSRNLKRYRIAECEWMHICHQSPWFHHLQMARSEWQPHLLELQNNYFKPMTLHACWWYTLTHTHTNNDSASHSKKYCGKGPRKANITQIHLHGSSVRTTNTHAWLMHVLNVVCAFLVPGACSPCPLSAA